MTSEPAAAISSGIHALEARVTIENREISLILGKSESTVKKMSSRKAMQNVLRNPKDSGTPLDWIQKGVGFSSWTSQGGES